MLVCETKDFRAGVGKPNSIPSHVLQPGSSSADTSPNEISKKGQCWFELKRSGMVQWSVCQEAESIDQQGECSPRFSSTVIKEENSNMFRESHKRKCLGGQMVGEPKAGRKSKTTLSTDGCKNRPMKQNNPMLRWSVERYKVAEKRLLEILKAEGATFGFPISRPELRMAARRCIGDTGLLDHLLKDIDGRIAPGGTERFRRCYDTSGVMQYWLESADLVHEQKDVNVRVADSSPPLHNRSFLDSVSARELKLLKEEVANLKRSMQCGAAKHQEPDQANSIEGINKELVKWKAKTEQSLKEISSSLGGMQETYKEILTWKMKVEQQLMEISDLLCSMQASKQDISSSPASERWEDWLEGNNLQNMQGEDFAPWLENGDKVQFGQLAPVQDPCLATPAWLKPCDSMSPGSLYALQLEGLKPGTVNMDRYIPGLPRSHWEDQTIVTPDSSVTANSNSDIDGSSFQFQEMRKDLMNWKAKVEHRLNEISGALIGMQASNSRN